ncbi:porin [Paraburkholderia sp.]|uniref:porin n=1 Tax=Paraburkholderia sp. TaxID=1926495 RepID=UPI0039E5CBC3
MKQIVLSIAVLSVFAGSAQAQSSVTLYGALDAGVNYVNNAQTSNTAAGRTGGHQFVMMDGGTGGALGSRWGLTGTEKLGQGFSAIFTIENGFLINNGSLAQGGAQFGRQAFVGLSSPVGTLTMGRQYDPVQDMYSPFLAGAWGGYMAAHPGDLDNALKTRRTNNSIKFQSANYRGLTVDALMNLGGTPGSFSNNWIWGVGGSYTGGIFSLGAGYLNIRNPNTSFFGSNPNAGPATSNNLGSFGSATSPENNPVYAGYASANRLEIAAVAAGVKFSGMNINLAYSNTRFEGLGSSSGPNTLNYVGTASFNNLEINASYFLTPSLETGLAYDYTRNAGAGGRGGANYNLFSAGLHYFVSKRTDLYTLAMFETASGTDSEGQKAVAQITGMTASTNNRQVAVRVGIRHLF